MADCVNFVYVIGRERGGPGILQVGGATVEGSGFWETRATNEMPQLGRVGGACRGETLCRVALC